VQQVFVLPLNYFRGSLSSPTNVAAMLPMLPEKSFVTYLLGTIDIFLIWWLTVLAIGLAVLYRRRTQPVAVTLFVIYAVIALCIAGVRSWMGGS
jgi:predicted membrane channel-forming protein YqfA (hemolysin III family)